MAAGTITAFSALAILLGGTGPKGEPRATIDLYATLAGGGLGAIAALVLPGRRKATPGPTRNDPSSSSADSDGWAGWRPLKVVLKVKESEEITSFQLEPVDGRPLPGFLPGQFLTIRLEIPDIATPVIRTYSLSDYPAGPSTSPTHYRLSIKREPSPQGQDVPPGVASNFLHDHIVEGSTIEARPASGSFVLDLSQSRPVVLISNGVGITPMMAMLKAAAVHSPGRKVWFIHGARDGRSHAFRKEVMETAPGMENLSVHYTYSRPREEDAGEYHSVGYVDTALIGSLVQGEADYFLCGSPPFLEEIRAGLQDAGVPEACVRFEMFTKPARNGPSPAVDGSTATDPAAMQAAVTFARSQQTALWTGAEGTLLEFAEARGLNPAFSCRAGLCGTCECRLLEGEVSYEVPPTATVAPGSVLICIARPKTGRLSLDL